MAFPDSPRTSATGHGRPSRSRSRRRRPAPRLLGAALAAARQGLHVFPLWPHSKTPCLHGKRHCTGTVPCADGHLGWEQRATVDPDLIRYWWTASPASNVGIACGPSNLYVLDLDPAHGEPAPPQWAGARHGRDVLARLAAEAGHHYPGDTYTVRTPSPSEHLYFRVAADSQLRNTAARAGWRIDSRGRGGFIVAAGSRRRDGLYRVVRRPPIAPLPGWLATCFTPLQPEPRPNPVELGATGVSGTAESGAPVSGIRRQRYLDTVAAAVAHAAPRTAHDTLVRTAYALGRLVAGGEFTDEEARAALHVAAQQRRIPAYEAAEAISSGFDRGGLRPRRLSDRAA
ncbi:bifunctional DNA primase/polymerase [Pseudonocardia kunmingensis]|uniref:Bifunctional DNA primase/polymerase-like protein n=1 Tax=Pseudonocardia kunmingensis TaxID=630975 RepID=A0A543CX70_9PSEU|nr:bifunctional DNA primase/polymerase [Pseudonocardia kunmingensis]TQM01692.1 bifunctional DNA primase/polymerase-like protein [Pseudonocardia kunmingensis]